MFFLENISLGFHFYQPSAFVRVTGDDAFRFLQGQFTNELRDGPGTAAYGLWLNQKGKVLADSYVLRHAENEFTLVSLYSESAVIVRRLEQYVIADDVTQRDDTGNSRGIVLWGADSGEALKALAGSVPPKGRFLERDGLLIFQGQRGGSESYEIVGLENPVAGWKQKLAEAGGTEVGGSAMEARRVSSGVPAIPQDIGPADLPNEAGLENTAISFTKGCYLGQEVMARLKNLGRVRRELRRVHGTGALPKTGEPLFQGAKKAGEIRSAVPTESGFVALAMLTRLGLDERRGFQREASEQAEPKATVWMS